MSRYVAFVVILLFCAVPALAQTEVPKEVRHIMALGTKVAPTTKKEILLVYMPPNSDVAAGASQFVRVLQNNSCSKSMILLGSEDTWLVANIILNAVPQLKKKELKNAA